MSRLGTEPVAPDPTSPVRMARTPVGPVALDPLTLAEAVTHVRDSLARGAGGRMAIVDTGLHRRAAAEPLIGLAIAQATLVLAESGPIIWASRIAGRGLPQRVPRMAVGDLLLCACASDRRRVYLVGGAPGGYGVPSGAQRAGAILGLRFRGLRVVGSASPPAGWEGDSTVRSALLGDILTSKPDLIVLGRHAVDQEDIIAMVRAELPGCWVVNCAGFVETVVGSVDRRRSPHRFRTRLAGAVHGTRLVGGAVVARGAGWLARAAGWLRPHRAGASALARGRHR